jgi:hypothetical protein
MCDEEDVQQYANDQAFLYRIKKNDDGEYLNGLGSNDDPFRLYCLSGGFVTPLKIFNKIQENA